MGKIIVIIRTYNFIGYCVVLIIGYNEEPYNPPLNFDEKSVEHLSIHELTAMVNHCYRELSLEVEVLTKNYINGDNENEFINSIENYFVKLSHILNFMNRPNAISISRTFSFSHATLDSLILCMIENPMTRQPIYLEIFIKQISSLIKKHKLPLKNFVLVDSSLFKNKIELELELTAQYLRLKDKPLAFISALNVYRDMTISEEVNPGLHSRRFLTKSQAFLIYAANDVHHGWLTEANQKIEEAIKFLDMMAPEIIRNKNKFLSDLCETFISLLVTADESSFVGLQIMQKITYILKKLKDSGVSISDPEKELENYKVKHIKQNGAYILENLHPLQNEVSCAENENSISYALNEKDQNNKKIKRFLKKIPGITFNDAHFCCTEQFMLSENFKTKVNKLVEIIQNISRDNADQSKEQKELSIEILTKQLSELNTQRSPKVKKRGVPDQNKAKASSMVNDLNIEGNYGFTIPDGYSPAVPIIGNGFPEDTLFITMPINREEFFPFLKLIKSDEKYHPVHSIAEKGYNQQGVKLGTRWIHDSNYKRLKEEVARVKILGTDGQGKRRGWGKVGQIITGPDNRMKKLYIIDASVDKEEEKRKEYKII